VAKVALLIGVGEYGLGLNELPSAIKDVEAMQRVLQHPEMGQFNQLKTLLNPDPLVMQGEIETLFADRSKDDLILLFFSGHGVKDESNKLYFATTITRKTARGELVKSTAVPASFVHDVMRNSRSKRQVVLLDCCFSGAFAEDMRAKDDGSVDVETQLGGEGRAVLTSSTSTQYSFEQQDSDLSVYTRFLVEGMETGAADLDGNGVISIDELHDYANRKVQESTPAMKPKIYAVEEGYKIRLAKAPVGDPKLSYRKEVERFASRGELSHVARHTLDARQRQLGISSAEAQEIEAQVLKPYNDYRQKLQQYEEVLAKTLEGENALTDNTRQDLKRFQEVLGLEDEDIESIEARLLLSAERFRSQSVKSPQPSKTASQPVQLSTPATSSFQHDHSRSSPIEVSGAQKFSSTNRPNYPSASHLLTRQQFLKWAGLGGAGLVMAVVGNEALKSTVPQAKQTVITENKTVTMATSADYPPYEFVDTSSGSQEIIGFDVDIAKYITEKLGYTLKIDNIDFNGLIPALQSKRADFVMAGMTPTAERKKNVDFSQIYYDAKDTIVAKKDSGFTSAASLSGKKLGVQLGSFQEEAAKKFAGVNVQPLNRINEMVQELKAGRIDAILMEDTVAAGYLKSNTDLAATVIPNEGDSGTAIAFPKGSPMLAEFDPILGELKSSGKLEEFITKWFGDKPA